MSGILKSDLYKIIPLTGGYSPVGVELILPASQFVGLNATVAEVCTFEFLTKNVALELSAVGSSTGLRQCLQAQCR